MRHRTIVKRRRIHKFAIGLEIFLSITTGYIETGAINETTFLFLLLSLAGQDKYYLLQCKSYSNYNAKLKIYKLIYLCKFKYKNLNNCVQ